MKKAKLIALMSAVLIAGSLTACVSKDNTPPPPATTTTTAPPKTETKPVEPVKTETPAATPAGGELAAKGKGLFEGAGGCVACHGKDGKATIQLPNIPNLTDAAWQKTRKDEDLTTSLKNGKNAMPKYPGAEADIPAVVAYVRSLGGATAAAAATPAPVEKREPVPLH